jgi:hypothetical protein
MLWRKRGHRAESLVRVSYVELQGSCCNGMQPAKTKQQLGEPQTSTVVRTSEQGFLLWQSDPAHEFLKARIGTQADPRMLRC